MIRISFFPKSSGGITEADLQPLVDALVAENPDIRSEFVPPRQIGYAVVPWETLTVYLQTHGPDILGEVILTAIVEGIRRHALSWIRKRRQEKASHRPFAFTLSDAEGNVLAAFDVKGGEEGQIVEAERKQVQKLSDVKLAAKRASNRAEVEALQEEILSAATASRERCRTTIIFCDIADSSALLSKAFPARSHMWLNQCRSAWSKVIEDNRGVVFQSYRDVVAGYFRDPDCEDRGAKYAAQAAVGIRTVTEVFALHRSLKDLRPRIGLATGVLAPHQLRQRDRKFNRTAVLAAALSQVAKSEVIAIDAATEKLIRDTWQLEPRSTRLLPQLNERVRFWRLIGPLKR